MTGTKGGRRRRMEGRWQRREIEARLWQGWKARDEREREEGRMR